MKTTAIALVALLVAALAGHSREDTAQTMPVSGSRDRIELVVGDAIATVALEDTPEARAFAARLPITVDMEDRFGQAKTGRLPGELDIEAAARSRSYAAGDLSYWSPSGKLAVVYDALGRTVPPPGLVRLGTVQTGLEAIASAGNDFTMTIRNEEEQHAWRSHARTW